MLLSDDESDYVDQVTERSRRLIRTGIWEGISESRLDAWLGCLRNFDAELLAAYLLDNLFFRSRSQFFALLDSIFVDLQIPAADSLSGQISLVEGLQSGRSENPPTTGIRLAPVIGKFSPPTKSGPYILRLAQRRYRIHSDWLAWPQALADDQQVTHVYFVDDFCGTGRQFEKFIVGIEFDKLMQARRNVAVTYLVTTIHSEGLTYIRDKFPDVHVKWAERLSEANAVLDQACLSRYAVDNFSDRMALEYERAVRQAGLPTRGKIANGFGQLGLAYGFAHATPNNTLPIFWMGTPSLTPLLDR